MTRFSKTSSLRAMKTDRTFSACARCLSNFSCKEASTVCLIPASMEGEISQGIQHSREGIVTRISDANSEKLVQNLADDLDSMTT